MSQADLNKKISEIIDSLEESKKTVVQKPFTASSWPGDKDQPALSKEERQAEIDKVLENDLEDDYFNL